MPTIPQIPPRLISADAVTPADWANLYRWLAEINPAVGAGTATLGANCPAVTPTGPKEWQQTKLSNGKVGWIPVWE
jgi:hypothetical protein